MSDAQYQTVTLVLADGRRCVYTGPPQIDLFVLREIRVVDVLVSEPLNLPARCRWERTGEEAVDHA